MLMQIKSMPLAKWFSTDYETEFPCTRSPWLNCNAIRQRYAKWGNAETLSRGEEHISKNKKVADSGVDARLFQSMLC